MGFLRKERAGGTHLEQLMVTMLVIKSKFAYYGEIFRLDCQAQERPFSTHTHTCCYPQMADIQMMNCLL